MIVIQNWACRSPIRYGTRWRDYPTTPVYEVAATVSGTGPTICGSCTFAAFGRFTAPDLPEDGRRVAFFATIAGCVVLTAAFRAAAGLTARAAAFGAAFAALAFLNAAQRLFVAAMIRARPSGLKWRFFGLGGGAAASPSAFRTAAHRFFCAAAMRLRAAGLTERFVAPASAGGAGAGCPPIRARSSLMRASMSLRFSW